MFKAIIFDFAGVVAEEGYDNWLKKYAPDCKTNYNEYLFIAKEGDIALIPHEKYLYRLSNATGIPSEKIWPAMRKEFVIRKNMISLIKHLKKHYRIGLLSNFPEGWLQEILKEENIKGLFDAVTISSEIHVAKPDKKIFLDIFDKLNLSAEEAIFIDDKTENVKKAEKIGMKSLLFVSYEKLNSDLRDLAIL